MRGHDIHMTDTQGLMMIGKHTKEQSTLSFSPAEENEAGGMLISRSHLAIGNQMNFTGYVRPNFRLGYRDKYLDTFAGLVGC